MRKKSMILIIILLCTVILFSISCKTVTTRPITLIVTDNETNTPISNVTVYYQLVKGRTNLIKLDIDFITIEKGKLNTDSNGKIIIPSKVYSLFNPSRTYEALLEYNFYLNIDIQNNNKNQENNIESISRFFLDKNKTIRNNIYFVNPSYSSTAIYIFNHNEEKEITDFTTNFFKYHIYTPFDDNNVININARLSRNAD